MLTHLCKWDRVEMEWLLGCSHSHNMDLILIHTFDGSWIRFFFFIMDTSRVHSSVVSSISVSDSDILRCLFVYLFVFDCLFVPNENRNISR